MPMVVMARMERRIIVMAGSDAVFGPGYDRVTVDWKGVEYVVVAENEK